VPRLLIFVVLCVATAAAQTGHWVAKLSFGAIHLRLALHLDGAPTLDSLDQDAFGLAVTKLVRSRGEVSFQVPRLRGKFAGVLSPDGRRIEGEWTQRAGALPLTFEPGDFRPQEPHPPYPYDSEEVTVASGAVRLAGTLTLPRSAGPHPAVVLITGSGPQDRDYTVSAHRPFLVWADDLTRRGLAVLRMDDRGVGGSGGKLLDSTDEDFASDLLADVEWLKRRKEIDPARIGLLGHSEGAVVASIAASRSRDIAFAVLLAGPAVSGERILFAQAERIGRAMGISETIASAHREGLQKLLRMARGGASRREMQIALSRDVARLSDEQAAVLKSQLGGQIDVAASRWFRFVLDLNPRQALERIACPVLAIYGDLDLQVPPDLNAGEMKAALKRGRVQVLPGLNHMLQHATTGSPLEYAQIEETVAPEVLEIVGRELAAYTPQQ
jgi:pimeloyl-ACP methyl ester carboxylesterase